MNIYDCFMYFDEDMLLDLRLNILNNIDPKRLPKLKKEIKETFDQAEKTSMQKAIKTLTKNRL